MKVHAVFGVAGDCGGPHDRPSLESASLWNGSSASENRLKPSRPAFRRLAVGMPGVACAALRCAQRETYLRI